MNKYIKESIDKISNVESLSDNIFLVRKQQTQHIQQEQIDDLMPNHYYMIEVADYIVNPFDGFTLHENWNGGVKPTCKDMQVEVTQVIGKMIKVNAIGDDGLLWSGWLPRKSITIKRVIA